eukprot:TRINITY_DN55618_c0_g1_i1.p1 TRINITY_DN55618_c0_g1~~TRINITY_DN55618_c0_g1_i1.p1  ORF type:complete len:550 (-),score=61.43 TRINITY_DN55618_c0_g1_i1:39-1688(-)
MERTRARRTFGISLVIFAHNVLYISSDLEFFLTCEEPWTRVQLVLAVVCLVFSALSAARINLLALPSGDRLPCSRFLAEVSCICITAVLASGQALGGVQTETSSSLVVVFVACFVPHSARVAWVVPFSAFLTQGVSQTWSGSGGYEDHVSEEAHGDKVRLILRILMFACLCGACVFLQRKEQSHFLKEGGHDAETSRCPLCNRSQNASADEINESESLDCILPTTVLGCCANSKYGTPSAKPLVSEVCDNRTFESIPSMFSESFLTESGSSGTKADTRNIAPTEEEYFQAIAGLCASRYTSELLYKNMLSRANQQIEELTKERCDAEQRLLEMWRELRHEKAQSTLYKARAKIERDTTRRAYTMQLKIARMAGARPEATEWSDSDHVSRHSQYSDRNSQSSDGSESIGYRTHQPRSYAGKRSASVTPEGLPKPRASRPSKKPSVEALSEDLDGVWRLESNSTGKLPNPWLRRLRIRGINVIDAVGQTCTLQKNEDGQAFLEGGLMFVQDGILYRIGKRGAFFTFVREEESTAGEAGDQATVEELVGEYL